tara:strand:+ start:165 stop:680 length:516 start_codon:yes stop_codon:yes gene_type:complete
MFLKLLLLIGLSINIFPFLSLADQQDNKKNRSPQEKRLKIVALTSLSADLVNRISKDSLIGIPGSSILKKNKQFENIPIVSSGRMPPNLEKIISLEPDLVIGAKGFHDRPLSKLNSLGINTLSTSISSLDDLDNLYSQLAIKLNTKPTPLKEILKSCYPQNKNKNKNKNLI